MIHFGEMVSVEKNCDES